MKALLRPLSDPLLHLTALLVPVVVVALGLTKSPKPPVLKGHFAHCRACFHSPPEAAAARDAWLLKTGSIEEALPGE